MSGWISIHRKIQDHWLWKEKPFDKRSAWIDILLMVNHEDKKVLLRNELIEVKRGSRITSIRQLCERWGWSNTKVKNFLNLLEKDNMLIVKSDSKKTTLTVVNYNDYQDKDHTRNDTEASGNIAENKNKKSEENIFQNGNKNIEFSDAKKDSVNIGNNSNIEWASDREGDTRATVKRHQNDSKTTQEHTNNNDNNDNKNSICMYDENLKNIVRLLEENIGVIPPILIDEINEYSKIFDIKMFGEAIKIAAGNKSRNVPYVLGILRNWKDNNILAIDDLEVLRREKEIEKQEKQQQQYRNKQYNKPKKTRFHNFEQRTDKYSADDLEEIARKKREEAYRKMEEQKKEEYHEYW